MSHGRTQMEKCCAVSPARPLYADRKSCPDCGTAATLVAEDTIRNHLKTPWNWTPRAGRHHFCPSPDCDTVYFSDDGTRLGREALRTRIGIKEYADDALLCYCFKLSRGDCTKTPSLRQFVRKKTRAGECSCKSSNPSGRCCLKDLPG